MFWLRNKKIFTVSDIICSKLFSTTGPRSTVGNVSGNRCESDRRSRGPEFYLGLVPYFRGDRS